MNFHWKEWPTVTGVSISCRQTPLGDKRVKPNNFYKQSKDVIITLLGLHSTYVQNTGALQKRHFHGLKEWTLRSEILWFWLPGPLTQPFMWSGIHSCIFTGYSKDLTLRAPKCSGSLCAPWQYDCCSPMDWLSRCKWSSRGSPGWLWSCLEQKKKKKKSAMNMSF